MAPIAATQLAAEDPRPVPGPIAMLVARFATTFDLHFTHDLIEPIVHYELGLRDLTGFPNTSASSSTEPIPSSRELSTTTSAAASNRSASVR